MSFQGQIQNGMVVFDETVSLPNGTRVRVEPVAPSMEESGTSQAVEPMAHAWRTITKPISEDDVPLSPDPDDVEANNGSIIHRVRIPANRVRIANHILQDETEWSRLDYRMGLAVEKFHELKDVNTKTP